MLQSMTGYGSAEITGDRFSVNVAVRTVNHRYLDIEFRMPTALRAFEDRLRRMVSQVLSRGHIEVNIDVRATDQGAKDVKVDWALLRGFRRAFREIQERLEVPLPLDARALLAIPDLFLVDEHDLSSDDAWGLLRRAMEEALRQVVAMRRTEGQHLVAQLRGEIEALEDLTDRLVEKTAETSQMLLERLRERMQALLKDTSLPEERLIAEAGLMVEKSDVSEELTRLRSHLSELRGLLDQGGTVGRKMDFLLQEVLREVNTVASKAQHAGVAEDVVEYKAGIEKLREQVQNVQ